MRIGIVADTHIPGRAKALPQALLDGLVGVDLIIHAGDLVSAGVLETLRQIAPVEAVAGNNDPPPLVMGLGLVKELELNGYRIGVAHGHLGTGKSTVERALSHFSGAHCVIFGHSHIPYLQWHGATLAFNPGSPTDRRRSPSHSYGLLHLTASGIQAEHRYL